MTLEASKTADLTQLALPFAPSDDISFSSFVGETNLKAAQILERQVRSGQDGFIYLAGPEGSGKTHLAMSALNIYEELGLSAAYLSLPSLLQVAGADLSGAYDAFKHYDALVIEDVKQVLPSQNFETLLFNLFNELKVSMKQMLVTSSCSVSQLNLSLPDLASRYRSGLSLRLSAMCDHEKQEVLSELARTRGLDLSAEVTAYIIRRSGRDLGALLKILNDLDKACWIHKQKQKLSIPFVKKTLAW